MGAQCLFLAIEMKMKKVAVEEVAVGA